MLDLDEKVIYFEHTSKTKLVEALNDTYTLE